MKIAYLYLLLITANCFGVVAQSQEQQFFKHLPVCETARTILRPMTLADAADIYEIGSDSEVVKLTGMITFQKTIEEARAFVEATIARYEQNLPACWAVVDKTTGRCIGIAGYVGYFDRHARAEIGAAFHRALWGKGIATEVLRKVIEVGRTNLKLIRIYATYDPRNIGSRRICEKLGFTYEGCLRKYMLIRGVSVDRLMFSLCDGDKLPIN